MGISDGLARMHVGFIGLHELLTVLVRSDPEGHSFEEVATWLNRELLEDRGRLKWHSYSEKTGSRPAGTIERTRALVLLQMAANGDFPSERDTRGHSRPTAIHADMNASGFNVIEINAFLERRLKFPLDLRPEHRAEVTADEKRKAEMERISAISSRILTRNGATRPQPEVPSRGIENLRDELRNKDDELKEALADCDTLAAELAATETRLQHLSNAHGQTLQELQQVNEKLAKLEQERQARDGSANPEGDRRKGRDRRAGNLDPRRQETYLRTICGLLRFLRGSAGNPPRAFPSQAALIKALVDKYGDLNGISPSSLENVFAAAQASLPKDGSTGSTP